MWLRRGGGAAVLAALLAPGVLGLSFDQDSHAYQDLLVTISPDIVPDLAEQKQIIEGIQSWITAGSDTLYKATRGWASIKNVSILLPSSWTDITDITADGMVFEDGNIRVDKTSGVYGDSPFTLQTGGCGDPGQYMQVTAPMLLQIGKNFSDILGPPGQVFAHEWAKYRYGVFEEHGYPGDERYPMFYIKTTWTVNGEENVISPNFCLNTDLEYTIENMDGKSCQFDEVTGLPDSGCVFVPGDVQGLNSSLMALPYIEGNDQFCDDGETFYHDITLPNKHNALCNLKSTFSVILQHRDFEGFVPNGSNQSTPEFTLMMPLKSASYVMVLDVSGSMTTSNRIERMKESALRWVNYDVKNDVPLGIVKFSSQPEILKELERVTDQNRQDYIDILRGLSAGGGTCLGAALTAGLNTLENGGVDHGGVIIFLTDGEQSCDGPDIPDVVQSLVDQGVRVIAIAFGSQADPRILELADKTQGKAFFIPDGTGPEDINNALQGSLTFQPSVPSDQIDIVIAKETFKNLDNISLPFYIDATIGNNVVVQIDFSGNIVSNITIYNHTYLYSKPDGVFEAKFETLPIGMYTVSLMASSPIPFATITITSKSDNATLPIFTYCWTSAGTTQADLAKGKVAVIAQVLQGTNPVIRAKVKAYMERDGTDSPIEMELLDQGADPDSIKDDGIYSRYFTSFYNSSAEVRYTLKCQVESTDDSAINQGFLDARRMPSALPTYLRRGRSLPKQPSLNVPICCGSSAVRDDSVLTPSGTFARTQTGGMLSIVNADNAAYPPGTVTNLVAGDWDLKTCTFSVTFTAPGAVLDSGTVDSYKIYYSTNQSEIMAATMLHGNFAYIQDVDLAPGSANMTPVEAGNLVRLTVQTDPFTNSVSSSAVYFFRLEASAGVSRSASNTARLYIKKCVLVYQESGLTPGAIAGTVIGTMLTVLLAVGAGYWYSSRMKSE